MTRKIFFKLTRDLYPQVKDRYPYVYLEHGRLEVDDSSVKWIDSECHIVRIPIGLVAAILLGPGTTITHEAVKILSSAGCTVCWIGAEGLAFYASGVSPTSDSRNLLRQIMMSSSPDSRLMVARRMFSQRFPGVDLSNKSIPEMMGMEGIRVRQLYSEMSQRYGVSWAGRSYTPGSPKGSDLVNSILTFSNGLLYGVVTTVIVAMGYSPRVGFVHSGSPMPFVYDMADLYKKFLTIDLSFSLASKIDKTGFDRKSVIDEFCSRAVEMNLLEVMANDVVELFKETK